MVYLLGVFSSLFSRTKKEIILGERKKRYSIGELIFTLSILVLLSICCLRSYTVGRDGLQYLSFYNQAKSLDFHALLNSWQQKNVEIGYLFLEFIFANLLNAPYFVFIFITSIISFLPFLLLIKKHSTDRFLSISLYVFLGIYCFQFAAIRQSLSIGFLCISFNYIKKKYPIYFISFVLLASLFHLSAVIFLPVYFFKSLKLNKNTIIILVIIVFLSFIFGKYIFLFFTSIYRSGRYYIEEDSGGFLKYIFMAFIIFSVFLLSGIHRSYDFIDKILFLISFFYLILWPIVRFNTSTFRTTYIFELFIYIFAGREITKIKDDILRIGLISLIFFVSLYFYIFYVLNDFNMYNNYLFFWQVDGNI